MLKVTKSHLCECTTCGHTWIQEFTDDITTIECFNCINMQNPKNRNKSKNEETKPLFTPEQIEYIKKLLNERSLQKPWSPNKFDYTNIPTWQNHIPASCVFCSNHPTNGGSGICHCILGSPAIF